MECFVFSKSVPFPMKIISNFYGKYSWKLINGLQKSFFIELYGLTFDQLKPKILYGLKLQIEPYKFSVLSL